MFLSRRMRLFPLSLAGCAAVLLSPAAAIANGIYKYVEKDGTIVYTNVPPTGKKAKRVHGTFHRAPEASEPAAAKPPTLADYEPYIKAASACITARTRSSGIQIGRAHV